MKKIGTLPVCGIDYSVQTGDVRDLQTLETAAGVCDCTNRIIWLNNTLTPEAMLDTMVHEALHALLTEAGVLQVTELLGVEVTDKWEEAVVRVLSPHIIATFGPPQLQRASKRAHGVRRK